MNKELSTPLASWTAASTSSSWLRNAGIVIAGSAFVALCSHVALPLWFTPVPLTLQPFAVLLIGLLLSPRLAAATLGAYLAEGAIGLPVFAPGLALSAGFAHLFGPTGGYLCSYPAVATLISFLWRRSSRSFSATLAIAALGNLIILMCGAIWLATFTHAPLGPAMPLGILPFLPGDALKVIAAAALTTGFQRLGRQNA